jgi:cytochrome c oxidase subunit II
MRPHIASIGVLLAAGCASPAPSSDSPPAAPPRTTVRVAARRWAYEPEEIHLKSGVPAVIELTSLDCVHGFEISDLHVDAEIHPGETTLVRLTPARPGVYPFHCSVFCGDGHESMGGRIVVDP